MPGRPPPVVYIRDLRHPKPTKSHLRQLESALRNPVQLNLDAVLAAARCEADLENVGMSDFLDRIRCWIEDVRDDTGRNALGHLRMFQRCVRFVVGRLRLEDLLRRHPEIRSLEIRNPIIIAGPPRSGTTQLSNLLAADARLRSLRLWEVDDPAPVEEEAGLLQDSDLRHVRYSVEWRRTCALLPHIATMFPWNSSDVAEDIWLQGMNFSATVWKWTADVRPWKRQNDLGDNPYRQYEYMKTALKALQWQKGPSRWVLKSPQHSEHLGPLIDTFPDATIVMTHRDPVSVIQSFATMSAYRARADYDYVDTDSVMQYATNRISDLLRASMRDRDLIPSKQVVDVFFHDLIADELATVQRIYDTAGLELSDDQVECMRAYLAKHARGRNGKILYDLERDFGMSPARVREKFKYYQRAFPVMVEVL